MISLDVQKTPQNQTKIDPKRSPKPFNIDPGASQGRPKNPPGAHKNSLRAPKSSPRAPKSPPRRPKCVQGVSEGPSGHNFGSIWTSKLQFNYKKKLRFPLQDHHLASNILCFTEGVRANVVRSNKGRRVSRSVPTRAHKRTAAHATTRRRKDAFRSCLFRCMYVVYVM